MTAHKGKVLLAAVCLVVGTSVANQSFTNAKNDWDFGNAQNWNNKKSIDYDGTETATSFYDPQLVLNVTGHYKLTRDLTVLRCVADTGTNNKQLYFDFDDGVTFTARGMANGSQAFGMNGAELYVPDDWLAKTRAALPDGARLIKSGSTLTFRYGNNGTAILFK